MHKSTAVVTAQVHGEGWVKVGIATRGIQPRGMGTISTLKRRTGIIMKGENELERVEAKVLLSAG